MFLFRRKIKKLVGMFERIARIIGGVVLIALSHFKLAGYALLIIWIFSLYGLVTGIIGYCPVLAVFRRKYGKKDCSRKLERSYGTVNTLEKPGGNG